MFIVAKFNTKVSNAVMLYIVIYNNTTCIMKIKVEWHYEFFFGMTIWIASRFWTWI